MKVSIARAVTRLAALAVLLIWSGVFPTYANPLIGDGSFQGQWDMETSQNGSFLLTLVPFEMADGTIVKGRFDNAHPEWSGTLEGSISASDGSRFAYNIKQPRTGMIGTGLLTISADGNSISGSFNLFNPADIGGTLVKVSWHGTRR